MIDWDAMTKTKPIQFIRKLDILVESEKNFPSTAECKTALQEAHTEGQNILNANNCTILKQQRSKVMHKLQKEHMAKMGLTLLRYSAKRLGIPNSVTTNKKLLHQQLHNLIHNTEK